jgi:predicted RNA-binding Zn ribbon-like protein
MVTPESTLRSEPDYTFDFCGGQLAIDFTNTVGSRGDAPEEHFQTFGDLLAWAGAHGILTRAGADRLRRDASRHPAAARAALATARELREALYQVIDASAATRQPPQAALATVNAHVRGTFSRMKLTARHARIELATDDAGRESLADPVLTPVVRAAVDLLTSDAIARVRICADETCAWLFLDTTRNRTRRWCDMKSCGNRSKVRRFRGATT